MQIPLGNDQPIGIICVMAVKSELKSCLHQASSFGLPVVWVKETGSDLFQPMRNEHLLFKSPNGGQVLLEVLFIFIVRSSITDRNMDEADEKEFVALANEFVQKCNLNRRVEKLTDCKDDFFVSLYQGIIGDNLEGLISDPLTQDERVRNCQGVIDGLANDVLNVDLSHISAEGITHGDFISIRNLLEIFSGLLDYFMECIDDNPSDLEDDLDDSNVMTTDHDVISSLLKEEFGSSYKDMKKKDSTIASQQTSNHGNKAHSGPPLTTSSVYNRDNHSTLANTRLSTDPASFRSFTCTASGHEADMSEISDSTNELIKLGESSRSRNSTLRKMAPTNKSLPKYNSSHQGPGKTTWEHSRLLSIDREPQELTQYTISSDEGDKDSFTLPDEKNGSDKLSISLVSSTSSWNQQISPLDADNDGPKLDTLGLRPKVDSLVVANKDSSSDSGGSGRSTPILHHHYHHHFHHPPGSDSKDNKTATSTRYSTDNFQEYTNYPGNVKSSVVGAIRSAPQTSTLPQNDVILPGQTSGLPDTTRVGLPGKSTRSDIRGLPGKGTKSDVLGLSGKGTRSDIPGLPGKGTRSDVLGLSGKSTRSDIPGKSSRSDIPGLPGKGTRSDILGLPGKGTRSDILGLPGMSDMASASVKEAINGKTGTALSEYSNEQTRFPGQRSTSHATTSVPLSEYSRPSISIPGESTVSGIASNTGIKICKYGMPVRSGIPETSHISHRIPLSDYSRLETGKSIIGQAFTDYPTLPGQSQTRISGVPDYSRLGSGITGQSATSTTASKALTDYSTTVSALAGQSQTRISGVPLSDYSRLGTGITGQGVTSTTASKDFTEYSSRGFGLTSNGVPSGVRLGTGITGQGVTSTTASKDFTEYSSRGFGLTSNGVPSGVSLGTGITGPSTSSGPGQRSLHERYLPRGTSLASTLPSTIATSIPSTSGLHTVSSGGLTDSVFTGTGTSDLRKKLPPFITKSLDTRQTKEMEERERLRVDATEDMVSTERPTASKDQVSGAALSTNQEVHEDVDVDSMDSDDGDDGGDDDDSGGRYSDSAIDYNRGGVLDGSESESEDSVLRRIHNRWKTLKTSQSSKPKPAQRAVKFNEDIETIPITSRMERLRRLFDDETEEQRQQTTTIRDVYAEQLHDIQKQQQQERKEMKKRKVQKSTLVPKKKAKKPVPVKQRGRLEAIYRPQGRLGRAPKRRPVKSRKRSASASPDIGRRRKTTALADFQETLLPSLFEEFPFLHVSPQTTHAMWQKQARQISLLSKPESAAKKNKGQRNVEDAEKRQERLLKILRKELEYNQRMRGERERQDHERTVKAKVNEKRQVAARARRYYDEYQLRMRSKMLKRRTREEQILKRLFDDGLEIQKQRVRELRKYAKEKTDVLEERQMNDIESLENYYKDQFSMLAEGMTRERYELKVRQQAQEKVMRQMRGELRKKMEKEIQDLQETLTRDEDSAYFRQLEADRLRREFQLAMYKSDI